MDLSVVIPCYNEAQNIAGLVAYLLKFSGDKEIEVIVADASSTDNTVKLAREQGAVVIEQCVKRRSVQMNTGAAIAKSDLLYFVHADCFPPQSFLTDILNAVSEGYTIGRYQTKFNSSRKILKLNAWFTRFDLFMCYGGDQTLFITRQLFKDIGGFMENMKIMEEYELVNRARESGKYMILPGKTLISDRKYQVNGWLKVQKANYIIVKMYRNGASQQDMIDRYKTMLTPQENNPNP